MTEGHIKRIGFKMQTKSVGRIASKGCTNRI